MVGQDFRDKRGFYGKQGFEALMKINRLSLRSAKRVSRRYAARAGDHVVILNYKDSTHSQAGGAEKYAEEVAKRLVAQGQKVTLVTARQGNAPRKEVIDDVVICRMGNTYTVYLLALKWLFKNKNQINAIVDTCNGIPFFSPLAVGRSIPVIILIHHVHQTMFAQHFHFPLAQVGRWIERVGNRIVYGDRAIVVVSPSSRTEVRRQLGLMGPLYVAANGQEPLARPTAPRSRTPRIACVGRLVPHKRWHRLITAIPDLLTAVPEVHVDLVGDGPCRGSLEKLAAALGVADRVTFYGRTPDTVRDSVLSAAWLTVCTSEVEGWGLAVTEAMSLGLPAVASAAPGLRDSVRHDETGWIVADDDSLASCLAEAIDQLAEPARAKAWADRCRSWSARFTWEATTDRLIGILLAEDVRRTSGERGTIQDISTVAEFPMRIAAEIDFTRLRDVDQVDWEDRTSSNQAEPMVRVLLAGFDEVDALRVIRRLATDLRQSEVSLRVARPVDLIGWRRSAGRRSGDLRELFRSRVRPRYSPVVPRTERSPVGAYVPAREEPVPSAATR